MTFKNDPTFAYKQGSYYEIFMQRAFNTNDRTKPGLSCSYMQNLINAEAGDTTMIQFLGSFEKQMIQVKKYIHKAMYKYLTMKGLPGDNKASLSYLKQKIDHSTTTSELMDIINQSLELTRTLVKH